MSRGKGSHARRLERRRIERAQRRHDENTQPTYKVSTRAKRKSTPVQRDSQGRRSDWGKSMYFRDSVAHDSRWSA